MKKSLIALAALATVATAAQAQSSVTVYGIVDSGFLRSDGGAAANEKSSITGGGLSSSRWGLRGSEDLGGGLSANFTLESAITVDDGTSTGFTRTATVGLKNATYGAIDLGRMNRIDYDAIISIDPFGAANIGGAVNVAYITSGIAGAKAGRVSDSVRYVSPTFAGLTISLQRSAGEVAGNNAAGSQEAFKVDYVNGKFTATAVQNTQNHGTTGATLDRVKIYGATYNFGVAKVLGGVLEREVVGQTNDIKSRYLGVIVPVGSSVNLIAQYTKVKNAASDGTTTTLTAAAPTVTTGNDADVYALGATYAFSKRTTGYAIYAQSNNSASGNVLATNLQTSQVSTGQDHKAYTVGIRHSF
jgi:predicted porin